MKIKISSTKIFNSFKKFNIFKKQMKIKISSTKVFNSFKKLKIFKKEKKKIHQSKFSIPSKKFKSSKIFPKKKFINQNFQLLHTHTKKKSQDFQKKKKKSSLNFSLRTKSYDPFPRSPVMQHQVNCPPSEFFEAWSMSQIRDICQVCRIFSTNNSVTN